MLSPGAPLPARFCPLEQRTRGFSVSGDADQFFWLMLVSTEEEKLVLEKSVSKVRGFSF